MNKLCDMNPSWIKKERGKKIKFSDLLDILKKKKLRTKLSPKFLDI